MLPKSAKQAYTKCCEALVRDAAQKGKLPSDLVGGLDAARRHMATASPPTVTAVSAQVQPDVSGLMQHLARLEGGQQQLYNQQQQLQAQLA
ncbi:hypothetical protein GPECTOR_600g676 [Gonium pectorale]|uniref:Uncharacterized protein n=1 Tax=Gonium pectorale TaxID=33097 RepID=A0A150FUI8_GONPE|nr:hypothetical protein GPECTOR_600g676 [Gonium pectorale]|eukprot:KXZ41256.1 hypothetical protein GPECTOR_600g676 [Gonium pectorale]